MAGGGRSAWTEALAMMGRRALTRHELEKKLEAKGHPPDEAQAAAEKAAGEGWIDDRETAARLAERWMVEKAYGIRRALLEMKRRGIAEPLRLEAVSELEERDPRVEETAFRSSLDRWISRHGEPTDDAARARLASHLQRRGFREARIRSAILDE